MVMRKRYLDDDEDGEVRDGQSVRVPLQLCDSRQRAVLAKFGLSETERQSAFDADSHRPHFPPMSDQLLEFRAQTRSRFVQDLSNAWRGPARKDVPARNTFPNDRAVKSDARAAATAAYDAMCARLQNAWCTPHRDAAEPDSGSTLAQWQAHSRGPLPGQAGEQLDPSAASAVEKQLESWQGRDLAELARDVEKRRAAAHAEFSSQLQNAWKSR
jgi:hypothetical protein